MPTKSKAYLFGVVGIGTAFGVYAALSVDIPNVPLLLGLMVAAGVLQALPYQLFAGSSVSLAFAVTMVAIQVLGIPGAILVNLASAIVHSYYPTPRPWFKAAFNAGTLAIVAGLAGMTFQTLAGRLTLSSYMGDLVAIVVAAGVYFGFNTFLVAAMVSLSTGRPVMSVWNSDHRWLAVQYLVVGALSLPIAVTHDTSGPVGLIILSSLVVLPWLTIRMYVSNTKEIRKVNEQLAEANPKLESRLGQLQCLHNIGLIINGTLDSDKILSTITSEVKGVLGADAVAIFLRNGDGDELILANHTGFGPDFPRRPELSLDGAASRALADKRELIVEGNGLGTYMLSRTAKEEGIVAVACLPFAVNGDFLGAMDICYRQEHHFTADDRFFMDTLAEQAGVAVNNVRHVKQTQRRLFETVAALAETLEAKDPYTRGHSEDVRDYSVMMASALGLGKDEVETLELAALFHDIGKIAIPDTVLLKQGPLNDEEWGVMRQHPVKAELILRHVPELAQLIPVIRAHHERYDGKGYPDGIPVGSLRLAAILAVADAYQAMTSDRPYRKALSDDKAKDELRKGAGTQFDPVVVQAFITALASRSCARLVHPRHDRFSSSSQAALAVAS